MYQVAVLKITISDAAPRSLTAVCVRGYLRSWQRVGCCAIRTVRHALISERGHASYSGQRQEPGDSPREKWRVVVSCEHKHEHKQASVFPASRRNDVGAHRFDAAKRDWSAGSLWGWVEAGFEAL